MTGEVMKEVFTLAQAASGKLGIYLSSGGGGNATVTVQVTVLVPSEPFTKNNPP